MTADTISPSVKLPVSLPGVADQGRADEPAEVADRVDRGDARSRLAAGQELGRQGPEGRAGRHDAGDGDREADHRPHRVPAARRRRGPCPRIPCRRRPVRRGCRRSPGAVGIAGPQHHRADGGGVGDGRDEADLDVGEAEALDDLRQPQLDAVKAGRQAEIDQREPEHVPAQRASAGSRRGCGRVRLAWATARARRPSPGRATPAAPASATWPAKDGRSGSGGTTKPSSTDGIPSRMNIHCQLLRPRAVELQQEAGQRGRDEARDRDRRHEAGGDPAAIALREPVGQIEDHAREEAGLGHAEQEAQGIEAVLADDEGEARRTGCPR